MLLVDWVVRTALKIFAILLKYPTLAATIDYLVVDIESFWMEGYAGQIPKGGLELAIYVL